jgi:hypothetical protein
VPHVCLIRDVFTFLFFLESLLVGRLGLRTPDRDLILDRAPCFWLLNTLLAV